MPPQALRLVLAALLPAATALAQATSPPALSLPACTAPQLALSTDGRQGCFDGMSHGGTMVVLRNTSATACTVAPFPTVAFRDRHHRPLPIHVTPDTPFHGPTVGGRRLPLGPGPIALPVPLAPGAEATFALRWVSGEVYDHSVCRTPAHLLVTTRGARRHVALEGHICGPDTSHLDVTATRLSTDPKDEPCS